jgi:hypothetical protein
MAGVKVRVFGEFRPSSLNALIGPDEASAAMKRSYGAREIGNAAKIIVSRRRRPPCSEAEPPRRV